MVPNMPLSILTSSSSSSPFPSSSSTSPPAAAAASPASPASPPSTNQTSITDKLCAVCGDKALGYNFNAVTCESCKAFFRRNALTNKPLQCPFSDLCDVTVVTRRFCQKCRLVKCFSIGMRKEYIMSEEDKILKKIKIEQNRTKRKPTVAMLSPASSPDDAMITTDDVSTGDNCIDRIRPAKIKRDIAVATKMPTMLDDDCDMQMTAEAVAVNIEEAIATDDIDNQHKIAVAAQMSSHSIISSSTVGTGGGGDLLPTTADAMPTLESSSTAIVDQLVNYPEESSKLINHLMRTPNDAVLVMTKIINSQKDAMRLIGHLIGSPGDALKIISKIMNSPFDALTVFTKFMSSPTDALEIIAKIAASPGEVLQFIQQLMNSPENALQIMNKFMNSPAEALKMLNQMVSNPDSTTTTKRNDDETTTTTATSAHPMIESMLKEAQLPTAAPAAAPPTAAKERLSCEQQSASATDINRNTFSATDATTQHNSTYIQQVLDEVSNSLSNSSTTLLECSGSAMESVICDAISLEYDMGKLAGCTNNNTTSSVNELNDVERAKLNELIVANKALFAPLDEDLSGLDECRGDANRNPQDPQLLKIVNLTAIAIRRLIQMAKRINAFRNMCQEDQVALLKGGCTEMMILRSAMQYDSTHAKWQVNTRVPNSQEAMSSITVDVLKLATGNLYEVHESFIRTFEPKWRQDENIILILSAIVLFTPDRPRAVHADVLRLEQSSYYYLLRRYLESVYSGCEARSTFLKLIQKIRDLQRLKDEFVGVYLNVNPNQVEPLLWEMFDLKNTAR